MWMWPVRKATKTPRQSSNSKAIAWPTSAHLTNAKSRIINKLSQSVNVWAALSFPKRRSLITRDCRLVAVTVSLASLRLCEQRPIVESNLKSTYLWIKHIWTRSQAPSRLKISFLKTGCTVRISSCSRPEPSRKPNLWRAWAQKTARPKVCYLQ